MVESNYLQGVLVITEVELYLGSALTARLIEEAEV